VRQDGTTILCGLRGVRVRDVVRVANGTRVLHVLTDDETAAACPACGVFSSSVRQRRTTRPRDLPYGEERPRVRWHKVQYACREALCARKAFTEQISEVPAGVRLTGRLRRHVAQAVGDGAAVSIACAGLMSWPIAYAAWIRHADSRADRARARRRAGDRRDPPAGPRAVGPGRGHQEVAVDCRHERSVRCSNRYLLRHA
jgi:hypothetical protein